MGNIAIAARALCQGLEISHVMPEENNKKTMQLGALHAPEEICLPFKLILGNFIETIERGADTILLTGSCGPCRYGEYCELAMKILKKLGYGNVDFIVLDISKDIGLDELRNRVRKVSEASPLRTDEKIRALKAALQVEALCDRLDARAHYLAGFEKNKGECRKLLNACKARARIARSPRETIALLKSYLRKLDSVELDTDKNPLKIAIIGEIFTVIDPYSNLFIEDSLMDFGVSTERMLTPTWWVKDLVLKPLKLNSLAVNRAADEYLPNTVGGHGRECVGEAVLSKKRGLDGAIQIFPLGCMPEVIAKSILPAVQRDKDFPVMTLIVDEVTGKAGYDTRIEAFLDMLRSRKRAGSIR
jgi:predicted nucleotide-binding protein (sugar kinase/HSP70/actin superfamily)